MLAKEKRKILFVVAFVTTICAILISLFATFGKTVKRKNVIHKKFFKKKMSHDSMNIFLTFKSLKEFHDFSKNLEDFEEIEFDDVFDKKKIFGGEKTKNKLGTIQKGKVKIFMKNSNKASYHTPILEGEIINCFKNVEDLTIEKYNIKAKLINLPTLKHLRIKECAIKSKFFKGFNCPALETLEIIDTDDILSKDYLDPDDQQFKNLKELTINEAGFSSKFFKFVAKQSTGLKSILFGFPQEKHGFHKNYEIKAKNDPKETKKIVKLLSNNSFVVGYPKLDFLKFFNKELDEKLKFVIHNRKWNTKEHNWHYDSTIWSHDIECEEIVLDIKKKLVFVRYERVNGRGYPGEEILDSFEYTRKITNIKEIKKNKEYEIKCGCGLVFHLFPFTRMLGLALWEKKNNRFKFTKMKHKYKKQYMRGLNL